MEVIAVNVQFQHVVDWDVELPHQVPVWLATHLHQLIEYLFAVYFVSALIVDVVVCEQIQGCIASEEVLSAEHLFLLVSAPLAGNGALKGVD